MTFSLHVSNKEYRLNKAENKHRVGTCECLGDKGQGDNSNPNSGGSVSDHFIAHGTYIREVT